MNRACQRQTQGLDTPACRMIWSGLHAPGLLDVPRVSGFRGMVVCLPKACSRSRIPSDTQPAATRPQARTTSAYTVVHVTGGKHATVPLAPRTARALDLYLAGFYALKHIDDGAARDALIIGTLLVLVAARAFHVTRVQARQTALLAEARDALRDAQVTRDRFLVELVNAQEREARKIADLLHDDVVQQLTALGFRLERRRAELLQ